MLHRRNLTFHFIAHTNNNIVMRILLQAVLITIVRSCKCTIDYMLFSLTISVATITHDDVNNNAPLMCVNCLATSEHDNCMRPNETIQLISEHNTASFIHTEICKTQCEVHIRIIIIYIYVIHSCRYGTYTRKYSIIIQTQAIFNLKC
jgi:hypothetical protein